MYHHTSSFDKVRVYYSLRDERVEVRLHEVDGGAVVMDLDVGDGSHLSLCVTAAQFTAIVDAIEAYCEGRRMAMMAEARDVA